MKFLFFVLTILVVAVHGRKTCYPATSIISDEACPTPDYQKTFDVNRAKGKWYVVKAYPSVFFAGWDCANVNWNGVTGSDPYLHNKSICETVNGRENCTMFLTEHPNQDGRVTFDIVDLNIRNYGYFIEMNYVDYYIFVVCYDLEGGKSQRAVFIVSRTPVLSKELLRDAYKKVDKAGFDVSLFRDVNQDSCN